MSNFPPRLNLTTTHCVRQTVMLSQYRKQRKAKLTVGKAWNAFSDNGAERSILFWSGGKDSFLTLRALQRQGEAKITLLTTFDGKTGKIPFQDTKVSATG